MFDANFFEFEDKSYSPFFLVASSLSILCLISLFTNSNEGLKTLQAPGCVSYNLIRATMQSFSDINLALADEFEKI